MPCVYDFVSRDTGSRLEERKRRQHGEEREGRQYTEAIEDRVKERERERERERRGQRWGETPASKELGAKRSRKARSLYARPAPRVVDIQSRRVLPHQTILPPGQPLAPSPSAACTGRARREAAAGDSHVGKQSPTAKGDNAAEPAPPSQHSQPRATPAAAAEASAAQLRITT